MTYRQLNQSYIDAMYMYPPNLADPCNVPQVVMPVYDPCVFPTYYVSCDAEPEQKCHCKEKPKQCSCKSDGCIEISLCYEQPTGCKCKKKKLCSCKKKKPCSCKKPACPQPCPPPCHPPCPPCNDPCNPVKGWPWITQSWGGR